MSGGHGMKISLKELNEIFKNTGIEILELREDLKSSEKYVDVRIVQDDGLEWTGSIPYFYRRTGLFIENPDDLLSHLVAIKKFFTKESIAKFQKDEEQFWKDSMKGSDVTVHFFNELLKMKWTSNFPQNDNPQRRIQDIKEKGYTIASRRNGRKAERLLLPIPRGTETGYEIFSASFRKKALKTLNEINIYELSSANKHGLLPDHKFPEIRWDDETRAENPDEMSDEKIKEKFQLLDNQRNQQKREVCRKCFQTGNRGIVYGIPFFYAGSETWDKTIPKTGKAAEKGCVGCGWYDLGKWREELIKKLKK